MARLTVYLPMDALQGWEFDPDNAESVADAQRYGRILESHLRDQLAWIVDPDHPEKITVHMAASIDHDQWDIEDEPDSTVMEDLDDMMPDALSLAHNRTITTLATTTE